MAGPCGFKNFFLNTSQESQDEENEIGPKPDTPSSPMNLCARGWMDPYKTIFVNGIALRAPPGFEDLTGSVNLKVPTPDGILHFLLSRGNMALSIGLQNPLSEWSVNYDNTGNLIIRLVSTVVTFGPECLVRVDTDMMKVAINRGYIYTNKSPVPSNDINGITNQGALKLTTLNDTGTQTPGQQPVTLDHLFPACLSNNANVHTLKMPSSPPCEVTSDCAAIPLPPPPPQTQPDNNYIHVVNEVSEPGLTFDNCKIDMVKSNNGKFYTSYIHTVIGAYNTFVKCKIGTMYGNLNRCLGCDVLYQFGQDNQYLEL